MGELRVAPGRRFRLKDADPGWVGAKEMRGLGKDKLKKRAKAYLAQTVDELARAQELLYANDVYSVLVIFQAMDAAGKDGTIKHVMSGVNPQGCQVFSFKRPSDEDLDHDFLWRYATRLPERGRIGIFNRSYYEEVLVVRVHPELLDRQKLPPGRRGRSFWTERYEDINNFERHLARNGTLIVKFFLNVSKHEQKRRFLERLDNPEKHWKFSAADVAEREHWDRYMEAYEDMLRATSTRWAPWYVVPADHKFLTHAMVARILAEHIHALGLKHPKTSPGQQAALAAARRKLLRK
ncbi:MAG: polyphosphate kinase 2 family protein [Burkholderiales bacterium]|nr:polyphosphate kinase 2 family protein [Burkholderiales bacterium]